MPAKLAARSSSAVATAEEVRGFAPLLLYSEYGSLENTRLPPDSEGSPLDRVDSSSLPHGTCPLLLERALLLFFPALEHRLALENRLARGSMVRSAVCLSWEAQLEFTQPMFLFLTERGATGLRPQGPVY